MSKLWRMFSGTSSSSLSQETPGEISWEDVDASLRSTFRGVDLAELHRGEPAGEDDIHTNNVGLSSLLLLLILKISFLLCDVKLLVVTDECYHHS